MNNIADLEPYISQLAGQRVLVIGDIILDEYLFGDATRLSREAPIPILQFRERRHVPGGAANPAANIARLGSTAIQIGITGTDPAAQHLTDALQQRDISPAHLTADATRPTTVKTRLMAHMGLRFPQQVARLDTLSRTPITPTIEQQVLTQVERTLPPAQAVLFSDYRSGLLTPSLVAAVQAQATANIMLTADAQGNFGKYIGFAVVKCNAAEAATELGQPLQSDADFAHAAHTLRQRLALTQGMVITQGADGATVATADGTTHHCPAPAVVDVFDTVGAGDTAIAVTTLALCAGASLPRAVTLSNYASGLVVRKVGNYAPAPDELRWALQAWA